jgi:CRP-like cAMP-binding protein
MTTKPLKPSPKPASKINAKTHKYEAGDIIFQEGDPSGCLFIIQQGSVAVQKKTIKGPVEIAKLEPGEVLGELSFFDRRPRSATAVAVKDSVLMVIDFESLDKVYATVPSYIKSIMAAVARRLRRANERIKRLEHSLGDTELAEPSSGDDATSAVFGDND